MSFIHEMSMYFLSSFFPLDFDLVLVDLVFPLVLVVVVFDLGVALDLDLDLDLFMCSFISSFILLMCLHSIQRCV